MTVQTNAKPGDLIEVHLSKIVYEGNFLESSDSNVILIKLGTGYNIGFNKKDVLKIRVLKKAREIEEHIEIKKDFKKPNVAMIICGGTIASRLDSKKGGVSPLNSAEDFFKFYPNVFEKINISKIEIPFTKDSSEMNFKDWQKIAKSCKMFLEDDSVKGIIITHGTDTLHYTSSALSFFLGKVNKPVVLTYSQRSIDRASSDATLNLECASLAAISEIAEVMVVGHASSNDDFCYAIPGTKVRKMHSSRRDSFKYINSKPFARIYSDRLEIISSHNLRNKNKIKIDTKFEDKIALIKFYPGQDPDILDYYVDKGYKGIVLEMFGLGQIARKNWLKKIREISLKGIFICATSQTIYGRVDGFVYSVARDFLDAGVIYLEDMLSETAFVKLGWILGHQGWNVKEKMLENFCREFNSRLNF